MNPHPITEPTDIRKSTTPEQKDKLRKIKTLPSKIKAVVYKGSINGHNGSLAQLHSDIQLYNLWEALLYIEGYESDGYYQVGTAKLAIETYFK